MPVSPPTNRSKSRPQGAILRHSDRLLDIFIADPVERGKGYGTAAQALALEFLLQRQETHSVFAYTFVTNAAERCALQKAGFEEAGLMPSSYYRVKLPPEECVLYLDGTRWSETTMESVTIICRCEDVTEDEVRAAIREGLTSLDEIKRILRCGMGHCQGRTCGRLIARIISQETGVPASEQEWTTFRPPTRPVPMGVLAAPGERDDAHA